MIQIWMLSDEWFVRYTPLEKFARKTLSLIPRTWRSHKRTNEHTNGRKDERKGENYIPLGINAGGIIIAPVWVGGKINRPGQLAPQGVKITRVVGKITRDSLPPGCVQGGKINCYTGTVPSSCRPRIMDNEQAITFGKLHYRPSQWWILMLFALANSNFCMHATWLTHSKARVVKMLLPLWYKWQTMSNINTITRGPVVL